LRHMAVVRMSDDARDLWTAFARFHGVSVSALLEACAPALTPPGDELDPRMVAVIAEARAIDAERRSRG
jgi:hypothetical protein